ncbi:MAG TPA: PPC domain-containing DNA-binding protein [Ramlibacter sp.]|uniref:PPC domain-containing DNA-binding protein n=1 Tax=Ramlibacter sp. TaxID=1917967 RepID=UPI002D80C990|nr:PPC domain-containing DNA-binding protein [Ramlibacter sp.]HET8747722.1 PPC domain-containing DNA-binding protein [Ramlibacter sp.]
MKSKLLNPGPERTYAVVLEPGDEAMEALQRFAVQESLNASRVSAIGAFERAELGYFEIDRKDYLRIPVDAQVEVLSLVGDVALDGGKPKLHLHAVLGRRDGSTVGGHLLSGVVRPTLEVLVTESPGYLRKTWDARFGLALIDPAA